MTSPFFFAIPLRGLANGGAAVLKAAGIRAAPASARPFGTRDEQEVAGYAELMELVFSSWQEIPFNENHIKQLHQILLRHTEKDARHRGQYKTNSNSVAAFDENGTQIGIVFETPTPFDTPMATDV